MKLFASYKQQPKLEEKYDAILIGSGLGCLTTAFFLVEQGKKVLLLEKHYTPGGFTHTFTRNDYEWDVGVHYVGDCTRPNSILLKIFNHITEEQLKWEDMGEIFDRIIIQDKEYPLHKGKSNYIAHLKEQFPDPKDQAAIDQYIQTVFECTRSASSYFAEKAIPSYISMFTGSYMRSGYMKFTKKTTLEVMQSITDNKELIAVLTGQYGDYGMPPSKSSFAIHATVAKHYIGGGAYPVGGSAAIYDTIAPQILKNGSQVLVSAAVEQILLKKGKAIGVQMIDGRSIYADMVISGAGLHNTFLKLIPGEALLKIPFRKMITKLKPSHGHLSLYIGFKNTTEELGITKANIWYFPTGNDHDAATEKFLNDPFNEEFPVVYMSFPSAKDPDFNNRYPGKSTIELVTVIPNDLFAKWEGTRWKKRGDDYEELKEYFSQKLLQHLYKFVPEAEGKIDHYELSTPLTTKHFANYSHGEIYGLDHNPERFDAKFLKPTTPIDNLYLTGQDIVTVGIGGALMSGILTASTILKSNLIEKIIKK